MRLPGGAVRPAIKAMTGLVISRALMNCAACSSSLPPISPISTICSVCGSSSNSSSTSTKLGADDRVAADAHAGALADAARGERVDDLVGQRAGARDDAHRAGRGDVAGHDAHPGLAGREQAGTVGADQPASRCLIQIGADADHVQHGDALGDADDQRDAGVGGLEDRVGGEASRDVDDRGVGARSPRPPRRRCRTRAPCHRRPTRPPLPGVTPATTLRAVVDHLAGCETRPRAR